MAYEYIFFKEEQEEEGNKKQHSMKQKHTTLSELWRHLPTQKSKTVLYVPVKTHTP